MECLRLSRLVGHSLLASPTLIRSSLSVVPARPLFRLQDDLLDDFTRAYGFVTSCVLFFLCGFNNEHTIVPIDATCTIRFVRTIHLQH